MTDKVLILNELKKFYNFKKEYEFADFLEIKPQTLSSWYKRNTFDIELIFAKCKEISPDWLLTGKGNMLRESSNILNEDSEKYTNSQELIEEMKIHIELLKENRDLYKEKAELIQEKLNECRDQKISSKGIK